MADYRAFLPGLSLKKRFADLLMAFSAAPSRPRPSGPDAWPDTTVRPAGSDSSRAAERAGVSGFHRAHDSTTRFALVRAVTEPAPLRQRFDVGKRAGDAVLGVPQRQSAHAGRVDDDTAVRQHHELARHGRVPPFVVTLAHVRRRQQLSRRQAG